MLYLPHQVKGENERGTHGMIAKGWKHSGFEPFSVSYLRPCVSLYLGYQGREAERHKNAL